MGKHINGAIIQGCGSGMWCGSVGCSSGMSFRWWVDRETGVRVFRVVVQRVWFRGCGLEDVV